MNPVSLAGIWPFLHVVVVDHAHRNTVGVVVHGSDGRQLVIHVDGIHDGKEEVFRLCQGTGNHAPVFGLQAGVGVLIVVPGYDGRIVLAVTSAVEIDADGLIGQDLIAGQLRGDILAVLGVLQFIVITRRPVGVTVFGECPECGVYVAADPLHVVTGIVAGDKCPVVVHGEELVSLLRVVPDTGVDDHFLAVIDVQLVGDADLLGGIEGKVLLVKLRALHQVHPGGGPVAGRGVEVVRGRTRQQIQGLPVYREVPLALVRAGSRDGADHRSVTRPVG